MIEVEEERIHLLEDLVIVAEKMMRDYVKTVVVDLAKNGKTPATSIALTLSVARVIIERYQFKYPDFSSEEEFGERLEDYKSTFLAEMEMVKAVIPPDQIFEELKRTAKEIVEENG